MAEPSASPAGQAGSTAPPDGTSVAAPDGQTPAQGSPGTGQAPVSAPEPEFFDLQSALSQIPDEVKPVLSHYHKQMQAAFTKKSQEVAQNRQKIEAYDQFMRDPVSNLQQMATQYGYSLTRAEAARVLQGGQQSGAQGHGDTGADWQPQTWSEVQQRIVDAARAQIMNELAPVVQNVQRVHASSIESQLEKIDSNWRTYEDEMRSILRSHPTLVNDVQTLYRMAVPEEVYSSRAVQAAIRKLQQKADGSRIEGKGTSGKTVPAPQKPKSFADAVEAARKQIFDRGR